MGIFKPFKKIGSIFDFSNHAERLFSKIVENFQLVVDVPGLAEPIVIRVQEIDDSEGEENDT